MPQPSAVPLPLPDAQEIQALIDSQLHLEGPLLPIFHALQAAFGYIPQSAIPMIASALNITGAEVHGVMSFYHDFRTVPAGRRVLKICRSEACQAVGGDVMAEAVLKKHGLDWHQTTRDGALTVEPVYCLGLCACGPAAMVDGKVIGRLDEAGMDRILTEAGA